MKDVMHSDLTLDAQFKQIGQEKILLTLVSRIEQNEIICKI